MSVIAQAARAALDIQKLLAAQAIESNSAAITIMIAEVLANSRLTRKLFSMAN